ncbi:MAG: hypothetical protein P4N60_22165 [Verrucomicrobiae bacterium]|nr:hypothetical protein [Verrucomicrobiae bacterium]
MDQPTNFPALAGKTVFMSAACRLAVLVTSSDKRMRKRSVDFPDAHAALDWCLKHKATFVLLPTFEHLPTSVDFKLN